MKPMLFYILFFIHSSYLFSQINPPNVSEIFRDNVIPRIDISISDASFQIMQQNRNTDAEYPISFRFDNSIIIENIDSVVIQLKGSFSSTLEKKSYKISINKPISGRKFCGMKDINLVANSLDPLMIRPRLAWYIAREIGITSLNTNYVNLYINNIYQGVYVITEQIDDIFLNKWFDNNSGNLYKCRTMSSLQYISDYQEDYKEIVKGISEPARKYDLKTNTKRDDYSDLVKFIKALKDSVSPNFRDLIVKYFNVQSYLKTLAFEIFIGHWDNYVNWGNNYMLYNNPAAKRFEYITFDTDLTFGSNFKREFAFCNIYKPSKSLESRPLTYKLLAIKEFRDMYSFYHRQLISKFPKDSILVIAELLKGTIKSHVAEDPYFLKSFTMDNFEKNMDSTVKSKSGSAYGLMSFINTRIDSTIMQLDNSNTPPIISGFKYNKIYVSDTLNISCLLENEDEQFKVELLYKLEKDYYDTLPMSVTKHNSIPFAYNCKALLNSTNVPGVLKIKIRAIDEKGNIGCFPLSGDYEINILKANPKIKLNEILAKNAHSITDEFGEHDDWIEIINKDTVTNFTDNCYLSDDAKELGKWKLPKRQLKPNELMFVWADNDEWQGDNHAGFKLSGKGEIIFLSEKYNGSFYLLDSLIFGEQETDISYGASVEELNKFDFLEHITPGLPNNSEKLAFVIFNVNMNKQIRSAVFNVQNDAVDVVGNFNNWQSIISFSDPDKDSIYTYTLMNMNAGDTIKFRFRMKHDNKMIEFGELTNTVMHRSAILYEGCNTLNFVFNNDSNLVNVEQMKYNDFNIYPNPATNHFVINSSITPSSISIINITGQTVFSSNNINSFSKTIDVSELPAGIYLVKAIIENKKYITKIIKLPQ
jgi:hypothetical protein